MSKTIRISPVTRVEGHLEAKVTVDLVDNKKQVVNAKITGTMFRGFEKILPGRDPLDAVHYTQRICGVCPVSHGMASSLALEDAFNLTPSENGRIIRNLVLGANFLQSHILHFYLLAGPDYINTEGLLDMSPWKPRYIAPDMIKGNTAAQLVSHYVEAIKIRRKAHEMGAIYAGKLPMSTNFVPGGSTEIVHEGNISQFRTLLGEIRDFIDNIFLPDVEALKTLLPEFLEIGKGYGNLLAYGAFGLDSARSSKLFSRGRITNNEPGEIDTSRIKEYITHSWYSPESEGLNPSEGITDPAPDKNDAYSWVKSPRYDDTVYELGPLARMWVNGDYNQGISVIDRLLARCYEAKKIADAMSGWLNELEPDGPVYNYGETPDQGTGVGLTEAPRGALGHWLKIDGSKISNYQVITPTAWNCSPMDNQDKPGALEKALIGTPVRDMSQPVEVLRVIHSFDPCLACAVHMVRPAITFIAALLLFLSGSTVSGASSIPFVQVDDPFNPGDETGHGTVNTIYRIGQYEVTNGQYTEFLNAVAASDTYQLYNPRMSITREGSEGSYSYSTLEKNKPVVFVSWFDALRFANWLHNGQITGPQDSTTTENGAYTFTGSESAGPRNPGARFFLPTEDEWYKAAYYQGSGNEAYWTFPTQSDLAPAATGPLPGTTNSANYHNIAGRVTDVGAYSLSPSFYGTFDQGGNVWEWIETAIGTDMGIRGGSWDDYELLLESWYRDSEKPTFESDYIGFRIAAKHEGEVLFIRGDVNQDNSTNIADAISLLSYLFSGNSIPKCLSATDANDDGAINIADAISVLSYLFSNGDPLPEPFTSCGPDPVPDDLDCVVFSPCKDN